MSVLSINHLSMDLPVAGVLRRVIHDVTLEVDPGEAVGLVGESGAGKSMTARAAIRLLPEGAVTGGDISFNGVSVLTMGAGVLREYRMHDVAMIFQDPRAAINPVRTIGDFLVEALVERGDAEAAATAVVTGLLEAVGIGDVARRLRQYPHELSGGLLQRVMIAAALAIEPKLLLADEPTTALDVTTQAEVMVNLDTLRRDHGLAMIFVTHDLELASAVCDRIAVMYAGSLVEDSPAKGLHHDALHPYTAALLASRPSVSARERRLVAIPGRPLSAFEVGPGCAFASRCPFAQDRCHVERPVLRTVGSGRVACHRSEELRGQLDADRMRADVHG